MRGPQRHLSQIAINAHTRIRVHPHTKHLHLSNIKVVMQCNARQTSTLEPGSVLIVVSIEHVDVLLNVLPSGFTGELDPVS